ncbi:hypothetical protein BC835DRAFT_402214 [Cytidiella melzeri]|nr:hypothetical protein BC835DRAFT_402214 [Cytidiella melzeri]
MGVPGLWTALRDAGIPRSLTSIAVNDGFQAASSHGDPALPHPRAFRIGIDASIWFVHAEYGKEGENPELRTIFFRLTKLLQVPFLPLFVFDGPLRPEMKRGKVIDMKPNWMIEGLKVMIEAFGFEWRTAPGEAEAELAYLNRIGVIDAVLTDDVDTLVFGATLVIRNQSKNLSGNRVHDLTNADGRDDKNHTMTFSAEDIKRNPKVNLNQEGLILIALLSGGDYSKGVEGCGPQVAASLAQCGFGESLVHSSSRKASKTRVTLGIAEQAELMRWLEGWREELCAELRTNSRGIMKKKTPSLAARIQQSNWLPDMQVLMAYVNPVTSEERAIAKALTKLFQYQTREATPASEIDCVVAKAKREIAEELRSKIVWREDPDIAAIARVCEDRFEWGVKDIIVKRFRSWLWSGIVCRMLRRGALNWDENSGRSSTPVGSQRTITAHRLESLVMSHSRKGTSRRPLHDPDELSDDEGSIKKSVIIKIHSSRNHASTDGLLEYRLEVNPASFVKAVEEGIEGKRNVPKTGWTDSEGDDEDDDDEGLKTKGKKAPAAAPTDHLRMWMPACMVSFVAPDLVQVYEDKAAKKSTKGRSKNGKARSTSAVPKMSSTRLPSMEESEGGDDHLVPIPAPLLEKAATAPGRIARMKEIGGTEDDYHDDDPPPSRPSIRTAHKPAAMPEFFKSRKPGISPAIKAKKPTVDSHDSTPKSAAGGSSTAKIASLFNDPDIQIFRDLTTRTDKLAPPKPKANLRTTSLPRVPPIMPAPRKPARSKTFATGGYIEISSESDVPAPPKSKSTTRPTLRRPQPDTSIIDLCSRCIDFSWSAKL